MPRFTNHLIVCSSLLACGAALATLGFSTISNANASTQLFTSAQRLGARKILWDYDSDWVSTTQGQQFLLNHNLGGDPADYLVYMVGNQVNGWGIHNTLYGGATTANQSSGANWSQLTSASIRIARGSGDVYWDEVRVRILKNQ